MLFAVDGGRDGNDLDRRIADYRRTADVRAIIAIGLKAKVLTIHERDGTNDWSIRIVEAPDTLTLGDPAVTMTHDQLFGRA